MKWASTFGSALTGSLPTANHNKLRCHGPTIGGRALIDLVFHEHLRRKRKMQGKGEGGRGKGEEGGDFRKA